MTAAAPVRVLHVIDSLRTGGAQRLLASLLPELAAAGRVESFVLACDGRDPDPAVLAAVEAGARGVTLRDAAGIKDPRLTAALLRSIRRDRIDVLQSHLTTSNVVSRVAARLARLPQLTTLHSPPGPHAEGRRRRAAIDAASARLSTLLVAPSSGMAELAARAYRLPRARLAVIPNVVPASGPSESPGLLRRELLGPEGTHLVLCVSRLKRGKGIEDLLGAAAALSAAVPGARVVVAGDGSEGRRLADAVAQAGLGDVLVLLGARDDVPRLLSAADAFCLPSRHEGVPLSLLEAMGAGLPCIATSVGGIPDVLDPGANGLLVPPATPGPMAAALARVLGDRELAGRLGARARETVEATHRAGPAAARYADLYERLSRDNR